MKRKYKSILCVILILAIIMIFSPKSQAAGLTIAFSKPTANVGDSVTVTVVGNGVSGKVNLSVSGNATLSQNSVFVDNGSASVNLKVNGTGSINVTATAADMADSSTAAVYTGSTGGTIKVASTSSGGSSSSSSSSSGSSSSGSTSGSSTTETQEKESSNANLSNLGIRPNDFSGFTPGTTTYNVTVPEDVESVEVYATAQDSGATISGTGNKTLEYGENALSVVVTAEDGTTKTYTINVNREGEGTDGETEVVNGLSSITIGDLQLSPSFQTDVYEYTVKYIGEDTSLNIETVATDPSYTVEIVGNEGLKEGENTITILVSDSEGNNVATYQLTVNKSLVDEEALAREEQERQQQEQRKMFMIAGGIIALILIIVIIIVIKRRRNRAYAEEFSGVPFAGINDEDEYDNNYDNNYDYYNNYSKDNQFDNYNDEPINGINNNLQDNNENQFLPEENSKEENQGISDKLEFDNDEEKMEKEKAKRDFLEGYNSDYMDEYEEEKPRRGRRKGKRFK